MYTRRAGKAYKGSQVPGPLFREMCAPLARNHTFLQKHRNPYAWIREQRSKSAHLPEPKHAGTKYPRSGEPLTPIKCFDLPPTNTLSGKSYPEQVSSYGSFARSCAVHKPGEPPHSDIVGALYGAVQGFNNVGLRGFPGFMYGTTPYKASIR